ncbi:biogenesis of lysosome-related organelles complex 1 subunit 5-like [Ruditapes philippinarum]|uniref:biogenesis of lysosome-related organelles complex 1 subunit 5-like n=1 Tax=Ruditapes philippinarum TaxID=129788 RepID=UPI00295B4E1D|nr:biogenesis of lysosome-related organelles complex 1 subunit 5-like [Ruditapes philippinarum]
MITESPILKDVWELHSRLFDHRPILQGHIRAFVKEFEEKRGNREEDRLNKIRNQLSEMKEQYLPETQTALDTFLANIQAKIKVAAEVCKKIEEKENNVEIGFLDLQRQRRREEWDTFMQTQFEKSAKVDEEMDIEMKKVAAEYEEMGKKIEHISTITTP